MGYGSIKSTTHLQGRFHRNLRGQSPKFVQRDRATGKAFLKILSTMIKGLRGRTRRDTDILSLVGTFGETLLAKPIIGLALLEVDSSLLISNAKELTALLPVFKALLPAGKSVAVIRKIRP